MTTALELIEAEERRRDEVVKRVRDLVASSYVVGGDTAFCTRRLEVHQLVAGALGERVTNGHLVSMINSIVAGLGGFATTIGGRAVFLAVRARDLEPRDARLRARAQKRGWRLETPARRKRARKLSPDEIAEWQERLAAEGLGEVSLIQRRRLDNGSMEGGERIGLRAGLTDSVSGVHRQIRTTQAEIYGAAHDRTTDLLAELRLQVAVLELRAQGHALRPIAIKLGIDKMAVSAILKRIDALQTSRQGCE